MHKNLWYCVDHHDTTGDLSTTFTSKGFAKKAPTSSFRVVLQRQKAQIKDNSQRRRVQGLVGEDNLCVFVDVSFEKQKKHHSKNLDDQTIYIFFLSKF